MAANPPYPQLVLPSRSPVVLPPSATAIAIAIAMAYGP